ncbi:MAG: hypothetical protein Tsb005_01860 [Gammaproteobacteria bacterium]
MNCTSVLTQHDENGWRLPNDKTTALAKNTEAKLRNEVIYSSIDGVKLDFDTGEVTFILQTWRPEAGLHSQAFVLADLLEILERNIQVAIFNLEPINSADTPYHPFNDMLVAPENVRATQLQYTMLYADHLLKKLTVNQEVQHVFPYEQRSLNKMIEHLPEGLRDIIDDFHKEQRNGSQHRFWIDAEDAKVQQQITGNTLSYVLDKLDMVIKKHKLAMDENGKLVDAKDDDEGWPFLIWDNENDTKTIKWPPEFKGYAIVFVRNTRQVHFFENQILVKTIKPQNCDEKLKELVKQETIATEVIRTSQNAHLLFI